MPSQQTHGDAASRIRAATAGLLKDQPGPSWSSAVRAVLRLAQDPMAQPPVPGISAGGLTAVDRLLNNFIRKLVVKTNSLMPVGIGNFFTSEADAMAQALQSAVELVLPAELAARATSTGTRAVAKGYAGPREDSAPTLDSLTRKAGLTFELTTVRAAVRVSYYYIRTSWSAHQIWTLLQ